MLRPLHLGVDVTLDVLIQRQCPAGGQERPDQQVRHAEVIRRSRERHDVPDERGREDHQQHAGLRERDEVRRDPIAIPRENLDVGGPDMAPHTPQRSDVPRHSRGTPRDRHRTSHRPITYTTAKTTTHTPSTKCQYQDTSSTRSAWTTLSAPENAKATHRLSMTSPTITCDACRPTSG